MAQLVEGAGQQGQGDDPLAVQVVEPGGQQQKTPGDLHPDRPQSVKNST